MSRKQSESNYENTVPKYNVVCKYYLAGTCTRTNCRFLHQKQNPTNQLVNLIQERLNELKNKLNPVSQAILFRRPLLHMVVLFANDRDVRNYSEEVEEQFINAGINVFTQYDLGDGTKQFIKPDHLLEIITTSKSNYLVVIGDRNMQDNTCQAKISGKLVAMPVSERIQTIQKEWDKEPLDEPITHLTKEQLQQLIETFCGLTHIKPRINRIRTSIDDLRSKGVPDVSNIPFGASVDKKLLDEFTKTQNSAINLHQELLSAKSKISKIPTNSDDGSSFQRGVALQDLDPNTEIGIPEMTKDRLINECNSILEYLEQLGSQLSNLTNTTSLWGSYMNEAKKDFDDPDTDNKWQCTRCTFLNSNVKQKCAMCDHPRYAKTQNDDEWMSTSAKKKKKGSDSLQTTNELKPSSKKKKKPKKKQTQTQPEKQQRSTKQNISNTASSRQPISSAAEPATGTVYPAPEPQTSPQQTQPLGTVSVPEKPSIPRGNPWSTPPNLGSGPPPSSSPSLPAVNDDEEFPSLGETTKKKKKKKKSQKQNSQKTTNETNSPSQETSSSSPYAAPSPTDPQYNPSQGHTLFQSHQPSAFTPKQPSPMAVGSPTHPGVGSASPVQADFLSNSLQDMRLNDSEKGENTNPSNINYFQSPFSSSRFSQSTETSNIWANGMSESGSQNNDTTTNINTRSSTPESSSSFGNLNDQGIPSFSAFMPLGNSFSAFQTTGTQGWDRILSPSGSRSDTPSPSPIDSFGSPSLYSNSPTASRSSSTSPTAHSSGTSSGQDQFMGFSSGGSPVFNQTAPPFYAPQQFSSQQSQTQHQHQQPTSRRFVSQPCVICGSESMFECNHCANMRRRGIPKQPVFFCSPEHQDIAWRQGIHKH